MPAIDAIARRSPRRSRARIVAERREGCRRAGRQPTGPSSPASATSSRRRRPARRARGGGAAATGWEARRVTAPAAAVAWLLADELGGVERHERPTALTVIKIGGGLASIRRALDPVCDRRREAGRERSASSWCRAAVRFADAVRAFDRTAADCPPTRPTGWRSSPWISTRTRCWSESRDDAGRGGRGSRGGSGPWRGWRCWHRRAGCGRRTCCRTRWDATSDSVAAFVAGALDADRLVLVKPSVPTTMSWTGASARCSRRGCPTPCCRGTVPASLPGILASPA